MDKESKFIKAVDFETPRYIKVLDFKRVNALEVGSKFGDKYGMTNRLTFFDYQTDSQKTLETTSYLFTRDYKSGSLRSGEDAIAYCVELKDPTNNEIRIRRWVFHKLLKPKQTNDIPNNQREQRDNDTTAIPESSGEPF